MFITKFRVENFRNYQACQVNFDPHLNLFIGKNAQGKTNLLEAIAYLGLASSFKGASDGEMIREGAKYFFIAGEAREEGQENGITSFTAAAGSKGEKRLTINNQVMPTVTDMLGVLHVVTFTPGDVDIIKNGPDVRRRYINQQMSQLDQSFCRLLINYNHILRQRNACLREWEFRPDPGQLAAWTHQLLQGGSEIAWQRRENIRLLAPLAAASHSSLTAGEKLEISYQSAAWGREEAHSREESRELFRRELERVAKSELQRGQTLAGPHRDDVIVLVQGRAAREFASQGQQRTAALSLKLAELRLAESKRRNWPILLLDDILSELDEHRRRQLIRLALERFQTFITATDPQGRLTGGRVWEVKDGQLVNRK